MANVFTDFLETTATLLKIKNSTFQELMKKIYHNNSLCYLGDFLTVRPPESCAMEDKFIVEWE